MMIGDVTTSLMQKIYSIRKKDRNIYIYISLSVFGKFHKC